MKESKCFNKNGLLIILMIHNYYQCRDESDGIMFAEPDNSTEPAETSLSSLQCPPQSATKIRRRGSLNDSAKMKFTLKPSNRRTSVAPAVQVTFWQRGQI